MSPEARSACRAFLGIQALLTLGVILLLNQVHHRHEPHLDLTPNAWVFEEARGQALTPQQAWQTGNWRPATPETLAAPKRQSTLWLRVTVRNNGDRPLEQWLDVAPWKVGEVDLYQLDTSASRVIEHQHIGLSVPYHKRTVHSRRNLLPVKLEPGKEQPILLRVQSGNRPTLSVQMWDLSSLLDQDEVGQMQHAALFGGVLAITVLLLLRLDKAFAALAFWLCSTFALQAELEGYISLVLFSHLSPYGSALRLILWLMTLIGFLLSALLLLDLRQRRVWRHFYLASIASGVMLILCLPALDINIARSLSSNLVLGVLVVWPFSLFARSRERSAYRQALVFLFLLSWAESFWFVISYTFNIRFTDQFSIPTMLIKLSITLGIIGIFTLQRQMRKQQVERELLEIERRQNARLEDAVAQRTRELQGALVEANNATLSKTEFLGRVSHDLRSPLTSIIGYAQLLQSEGGPTMRKAGVILSSASHMLTLINDLIDHARDVASQTLEIAPAYIHGILDSVAMDAQILAQRNRNEFLLTLSGELPTVLRTDAKRLRQILINLLDNAAKFTRDGRIELQVHATAAPLRAGAVHLSFCVHDTGCGIAEEDLPKLFNPFFRCHVTETEGSGLGLAIVEHWVRLMEGSISVQSAPGEGTQVRFDLTVFAASEQDMNEPQLLDVMAKAPSIHGRGLLVWVVEDNDDIRELLVDELETCHFRVAVAVDGQDCIERLMTPGKEPPDLVLTDCLMPRLNGSGLLIALRECWPRLPVVLISATEKTMQSLSQATSLGFDASLTKPISLADLRATLAQLLHLAYGPEPQATGHDHNVDVLIEQLRGLGAKQQDLWQLLEAGALTDLIDWSRTLPQDCRELADYLKDLGKTGDLNAVQKLVEHSLKCHPHTPALGEQC